MAALPVRDDAGAGVRKGAALFGYTKLYGAVPGGQAEYLRVPLAQFGPIKVPDGPPDDRFLYLSDVLPTAWQAVEHAEIPQGGSWPCSASVRSADVARIGRTRLSSVHRRDSVGERLSWRRITRRDARPRDDDEWRTQLRQ